MQFINGKRDIDIASSKNKYMAVLATVIDSNSTIPLFIDSGADKDTIILTGVTANGYSLARWWAGDDLRRHIW